MRAADQVYAALHAARTLPGWTVSRLGPDTHRVTSPTGTAVICTEDPDAAEDAMAELDNLGLNQDMRHAPVPQPVATGVASVPQLVSEPQLELELVAVPPEAPASATEQEISLVPSPAVSRRRSKLTVFRYPEEAQAAPSLDAVMPDAFAGQGRLMVPALIVTPEIAGAWLNFVAETNNRKRRRSNVDKFERLIEAGEFDHTHQGAAFNEDGQCADAQHRLQALVNVAERNPDHEYSIVMDVTYNAPVTSAKHYDGGAGRDAKDRLNVEGLEGDTAPLLRLLWSYEGAIDLGVTFKSIPAMTEAVLIDWGHTYSEDLAAHRAAVRRPLRDLKRNLDATLNINVASVTRYLALQEWEASPFDDFLDALAEPTKQHHNSPQRALASWLRQNVARRGAADTQTVMAMTIIAYNDYCQDLGRAQMRWVPGHGMPRLYAGPNSKKPAPAKKPAAKKR